GPTRPARSKRGRALPPGVCAGSPQVGVGGASHLDEPPYAVVRVVGRQLVDGATRRSEQQLPEVVGEAVQRQALVEARVREQLGVRLAQPDRKLAVVASSQLLLVVRGDVDSR